MTTMPLRRGVMFSIRVVARVRKVPRPVAYPPVCRPGHDPPAPGRSGPGTKRMRSSRGGVRVLDEVSSRLDHFDEVVRGHVRRHAHGDAARAVDEQVREGGGEDLGLEQLVVVVGHLVDGVLVQARRREQGGWGEPGLGVPGGGRAAVEGAEVAVPVDEREAHRERLGHPHQGVIDRLVPVRVVLAHDLTDDPGGT